ncbi:putative phage abortive infection protein [Pseudoalteromonas sp. SA25]|uniref:putative phage abortive infection protein n=1 Tax=Pseudoalteromonas sp. SA25 TaxID=2686347 RepID=UPI0013FD3DE0|nr:putative phage abortive infection protein [Pseudoalteromonas sp. SA25]
MLNKKLLKNPISWFVAFAIGFAGLIFGLYFNNFSGEFSASQSDWGSFGSYIGGTIGAVFALLSFLALVYTVCLQRKELKLAIEALNTSADAHEQQVENNKLQKFESTFYSLLELHNNALKDLMSSDSKYKSIPNRIEDQYLASVEMFLERKQKLILEDELLSQYFRILYQLLKFVAKNNVKNSGKRFNAEILSNNKSIKENNNEEKMYVSIIRGFVPVNLLPVLALNCIPSYNCINNLDLYWEMLERYEFLEHIKLENLNIGLSAFTILNNYAFALGHNDSIEEKYHQLKGEFSSLFDSELTEGCYLHVRYKVGV